MVTWSPDKCAHWAMPGECANGHGFAKELFCLREWHADCREKGHSRRMGMWLHRARKLKRMGYLVVTVAKGERWRFRDVAELRRVRRGVIRALKARGFGRGLARWHWFSEAQPGVFNPHLNLLLDAGHIRPKVLAELKRHVPSAAVPGIALTFVLGKKLKCSVS